MQKVFSMKKEDLLNIAYNLSDKNNATSLEDEGVRKEISFQLLFIREVLNYYNVYKRNRSIENCAQFTSGCSLTGFFAASLPILGAMNSGLSLRQLISMGSGTITWYGIGFMFHFAMLMTSFYIQDEVKIDQQWLAQLLLCYRSSVLKMALIINHEIEQKELKIKNGDIDGSNVNNANILDMKELLQNSENVIKRFDDELDAEQLRQWLEFAISDNNPDVTLKQQAVGYIIIPGSIAISSKYVWSAWRQSNKLNITRFALKSSYNTKWGKFVWFLVRKLK